MKKFEIAGHTFTFAKNADGDDAKVTSATCTWFDIFLALTGETEDTVKLGADYARDAYQKLITALSVMIVMIGFGLIFNVTGHCWINIILATIFAVVTAVLWWRPGQVAWVGVAGAIIGKLDKERGGLSGGAKWLISKYASIFKLVTMVGTIVLFYLGFMPFGENPTAFFVIVSGGIGASLLANSERYKKVLEGTFAAEFVFYGMCVIIVLAIFSLVPQQSWGGEKSFAHALINNVKGGLFLFALLLALIVTLIMRRTKAKAEGKKGWPWMIIFLFGLMDFMYMPMDMLAKYNPLAMIRAHYANTPPPTVAPTQAQAPSVSPIKVIHLGSEWSKAVYPLPMGGEIGFTCTMPGAEMMIDFTSAKSTVIAPGEAFPCSGPVRFGEGFVNAKYYFRNKSNEKGDVFVQNSV
ncbi:MAG: hypothetical protein HZB12_01855 [Candidatus Yonathbacteria bacterium]|nr:hypothetical protein [Candidatus Yonathbacteria bacterium]